jgi:uncharacterized protein (TIGR03382 family)
MGYVVAGYTIVLAVLFLYGVSLVWRRRRLTAAAERVASSTVSEQPGAGPAQSPLAGHDAVGVPR